MVHSAMVASIASPIVTRTLTAVEQPRAPIAHSIYDLNPDDLISPEAAEKDKMAVTPKQAAVRLNGTESSPLCHPRERGDPESWRGQVSPIAARELSAAVLRPTTPGCPLARA